MSEAVVLAFLASVLAVPGAVSIITSIVRKVTDAVGVEPRLVVYVVAYILSGVIMAGADLPAWAGDPFAYVVAWATVATVTAETARRLYDAILSHLPGLAPSA